MASFDTPFPSGLVDWEKSQIRIAIKEKIKKELGEQNLEDSKLLAELLKAALDDLNNKKD